MNKNQVKESMLEHIKSVRDKAVLLCKHIENKNFVIKLMANIVVHDHSKLLEPEFSTFLEYTPKLKKLSYGSSAYKESLEKMGEALTSHYAKNKHHPEYFENGINGMNLFDLLEMFCDWCAACERHEDGNIFDSFKKNQTRFNICEELTNILLETAKFINGDKDELTNTLIDVVNCHSKYGRADFKFGKQVEKILSNTK